MKIAAIVITCNRLLLLSRALNSIKKQNRKTDMVFVISNSTNENFEQEEIICNTFGFPLIKNSHTANHAGAMNASIEEIINHFGIKDDVYFATLDDDDEWLPNYLSEIEEANNDGSYDIILSYLMRINHNKTSLQVLPTTLSIDDFLKGNPGIGGANTFVRLKILLQAGCFDESMPSNIDRDLFVRLFLLKPTYKIIHKHLVNIYTDNERPRVTNNVTIRIKSFQYFYYKYAFLMSEEIKQAYFAWANSLFALTKSDISNVSYNKVCVKKINYQFEGFRDFNLIIGFITDSHENVVKLFNQIILLDINPSLILVIDNTINSTLTEYISHNIPLFPLNLRIISKKEWKNKLESGIYGSYLKNFDTINSIPLGRTILHHHLYMETIEIKNPVYWIIDDDISFSVTTSEYENINTINLIEIINVHYQNADALIGSISNDAPVPTLSCIRGQLIDFLHSHFANNTLHADHLEISTKFDYYYDLSDAPSNHLETPIYHSKTSEKDLALLFSGKSLSRPALQKQLKAENKTITKRGANTLVFNRELLRDYPVINLEVNNKFARRGDLLWALLNQVISGKIILEHTFSLDHTRPLSTFVLENELNKAAYDIIGYAFNKGFLEVVNQIKKQSNPQNPQEIFEKLSQDGYYQQFLKTYHFFLKRRSTKFLMNYYRIIGLTKLLSVDFGIAKQIYTQISDETALNAFYLLLTDAQNNKTLTSFFKEFFSVMDKKIN